MTQNPALVISVVDAVALLGGFIYLNGKITDAKKAGVDATTKVKQLHDYIRHTINLPDIAQAVKRTDSVTSTVAEHGTTLDQHENTLTHLQETVRHQQTLIREQQRLLQQMTATFQSMGVNIDAHRSGVNADGQRPENETPIVGKGDRKVDPLVYPTAVPSSTTRSVVRTVTKVTACRRIGRSNRAETPRSVDVSRPIETTSPPTNSNEEPRRVEPPVSTTGGTSEDEDIDAVVAAASSRST